MATRRDREMVELLTVREVAERLRTSRPTVRSMLREGLLEGFQRHRVVRISRESVERLIRAGVGTAPASRGAICRDG